MKTRNLISLIVALAVPLVFTTVADAGPGPLV